MRRLLIKAIAILAIVMCGGAVSAQAVASPTKDADFDAKFMVQVDLDAFLETPLGAKLLTAVQQVAQQEIGDDSVDVMAKVEEVLGFNPLEEVHHLTVVGSSFDKPESSLKAIIQLGKTTGNLEGLLLALPGYEVHERDQLTIHSVREHDRQVFATIVTGADGNKRILAATSIDGIQKMTNGAFDAHEQFSRTVPGGTFVQVRLLEFPPEVYKHDQPANIAKLLKDVSATVGVVDEDYAVNLILAASDVKRAEQIQQLVQGLKALVGLLEGELGEDEDAKLAIALLNKVTVERVENTVIVHGMIPQELIINFLRDEADFPL